MPDLSSSAAVSPASVMALTLDHSGLYREQASFASLADFLRQSRFARPSMCGWTPGPLATNYSTHTVVLALSAYCNALKLIVTVAISPPACCLLLLLPGGSTASAHTVGGASESYCAASMPHSRFCRFLDALESLYMCRGDKSTTVEYFCYYSPVAGFGTLFL